MGYRYYFLGEYMGTAMGTKVAVFDLGLGVVYRLGSRDCYKGLGVA